MSDFSLYFQLGIEHIADYHAYDHMLFVISLCALFQIKHWKTVLILVTAFTIGHSFTLALSVLDMVNVNASLIETLIPITILLTSLFNLYQSKSVEKPSKMGFHYSIALFFGFIHGMGFANYLSSLLGGSEEILFPLLSFNLGIEIGQISIVITYFFIYFIVFKLFKVNHRKWAIGVSLFTGSLAFWMILKNINF